MYNGNLSVAELCSCLGGMTVQGVYKTLRNNNIKLDLSRNGHKMLLPENARQLFDLRGFEYPNLNISFQIVKGGVGKTSLSFSLATRASHYGAKVLAIDFDQQGNLTRSFNVEAREKPVWLNILRDNVEVEDAVINVSNHLDLIASNLNNSRLDVELTQSSVNFRDVVRDLLSPIRDNYDLVIMDCPPAINKINTTVTCASDLIIIPINPDPYAMDGLEFTLAELKKLKKEFKLSLEQKILWNRYDARERLGTIYMHELAKNDDMLEKLIPIVIRADANIKNAIFDAKNVFISKKSAVREDIDQFTKEILGITAWSETVSRK